MPKRTNKPKKEKTWYFYLYATGHGIPSHLILHVGYSESNQNYYPTWFSEGMTLDTAHKIYEKVKFEDGTPWSGAKAQRLKEEINNYIKTAKEGKL
jgi:hypothetical protein